MPLINALLPLIRPLQITSLNPFSVTSLNCFTSKRSNTWSVCSILLLILLISHGIFDTEFYSDVDASTEKTIVLIKLCMVRLGHVTILIESFVQRTDLIEIINALSVIDSTLVKELGVDVRHKDLKKLVLQCLLIGSAIFISIESSVLAIFMHHSSSTFVSFWIARLFSFSVICLRYLQLIIFVYIVQSRLSLINRNLTKIDTIETFNESSAKLISIVGHLEEDNRDMLKMKNKKFNNFDEIAILRKLFGKLWDVSKLINDCFGWTLLSCVGNDFGTLTLNGYWMYLSYRKTKNVAIICSIGFWSIPHIIWLLLIAGICYTTVSKVSV